MRSMRVVVRDVLGEDGLEMAPAEDERPVEALAPEGADQALADGVRPRCADRSLGVAISDEELDRVRVLAEIHA